MATVDTVGGRIESGELGLTLIHEHFFSSDEAVSTQWPHIRDRKLEHELALEAAEAVKGHGVKTVVDPTAMLLGRDIPDAPFPMEPEVRKLKYLLESLV